VCGPPATHTPDTLTTNQPSMLVAATHAGSEEKFNFLLKLQISAFRVYENNAMSNFRNEWRVTVVRQVL